MDKKQAQKQSPTLIVVSSADPLRSEGEAFGELLQSNGLDCAIVLAYGQSHDTVLLEATRYSSTPRAMMTIAAERSKEALAPSTAQMPEKESKKTKMSAGKKRKYNSVHELRGYGD